MKIIIHFIVILLFLITFVFEPKAQTSPYIFENIGIQDGLSQSVVNTIIQDNKGFLWIGTQDGLCRFDGYNFKIFRPDFQDPENSITNGLITTLENDLNGSIVIGTLGGGLDVYDPVLQRFHHIRNRQFSAKNIGAVFIDGNNNYIVIHENGISKISFPLKNNYDTILVKDVKFFLGKTLEELSRIGLINLLSDKDNNMIVQFNTHLYFFDKQDTDFDTYTSDKLPSGSFMFKKDSVEQFRLGRDIDKRIWIIYRDRAEKIIDFRKNTKDVFYFKHPIELTYLDRFLVGSDSCIYTRNIRQLVSINLKNSGISYFKKEANNSKSIASDVVNFLFQDKRGVFWFATNNGLSKYNPSKNKFRHIEVQPLNNSWLQDYWPFCFCEDKYGNIWVGTYNGKGIYVYNKKTNTFRNLEMTIPQRRRIPNKDIMSLFRDSDGQMWVGTGSNGLAKYNEKSNNFYFYLHSPNDSTSISNNIVYHITEDKSGDLWLATSDGVNKFNKKTGKFTRYRISDKVSFNDGGFNRVQSIVLNDDGSMWLATFNSGLQKMYFDENGKPHFKQYVSDVNDSTSLSFDNTFSLLKDKDNNLWISTFGGGINKLDSRTGKFKRYTVRNSLPNNVVYGALQDQSGRIWLSTNYGLSVIDEKNHTINNYTVNQGLQSNEFNQNAFYQDSEGLMYFGGVNGYNVFNPSQVQLDATMSEVIFTDFKLSNNSVSPGEKSPIKVSIAYASEIELKYWQNDFSFEFTSDNYSASSDIQFSYMIENYHANWIKIGHQRSISFSGLRPGEYLLKVRATNPDGVWSNKYAVIKITINPPFWETGWFRLLVVAFIIAGILIYIRWRTKKLLKEKQILEQKVKERTSEIEEQKNEILEKNEELKQLNEEISTHRDNLKEMNAVLTEKHREIGEQKNQILNKNEELNQLNHEISAQRDNLKEMNEELASMNDEILKQKQEIVLKNINITSSIEYAERIQQALLPSQKPLQHFFSESFIFYRPKDIVSGDFYFINQVDKYVCLAAADCTGHGVPGAFMSILGITLLKEITGNEANQQASRILEELRLEIKNALRQTGETGEQQDGLDIAFCIINTDNLSMQFAGANLPLWIIRQDKLQGISQALPVDQILTIYGEDKQPIGIYPKESSFTNHQVHLEKGDLFYIFTDGYHSQFGGGNRNKMRIKRFQEIVVSNAQKSMEEQKYLLEQEFDAWRGANEQVDDVLVIGIKV